MEGLSEIRFIVKEATRFPVELVDKVMIHSRRALRAVIRIQAAIRAFRPRALFMADFVNFDGRDDLLKSERQFLLQSKSYKDWNLRTGMTDFRISESWKNRRWKDLMMRNASGNYLMTHYLEPAHTMKGAFKSLFKGGKAMRLRGESV